MYTKESSHETFRMPKNNLDVTFEEAYKNHNNEVLQARVENKISTIYDGKVPRHNKSDAQDAIRTIPGISCAVFSTQDKLF